MSHISSLQVKDENRDKKSKLKKIKTSKIYFLITAFSLTCIAISVSLFIPKEQAGLRFQFPNEISLPDWQSQSSDSFDKVITKDLNNRYNNEIIVDARQYVYTSSAQDILKIDALYVRGGAIEIPKFLETVDLKYSINSLDIRYSSKTGYYALFTDQKKVYLSSCISPRGISTVTREQLINNRNNYDFKPDRLISYLIGTIYLRDRRCLFTVMSIPLKDQKVGNPNSNSLDNTYKKLEKSWISWYQKWENNFPKN
jgi:cyanosortase A-associated protein